MICDKIIAMNKKDNLIWMDLEFSGLDFKNNTILEIATIATDKDLNILEEGPSITIGYTKQELDEILKDCLWCQENFKMSGLEEKILSSKATLKGAEKETIEFIERFIERGQSPLCGNSIWQDRRVLTKDMPDLESFFHYRNIDVSSIKEVVKRWYEESAEPQKQKTHRALDDIKESIEELKFYRNNFFR